MEIKDTPIGPMGTVSKSGTALRGVQTLTSVEIEPTDNGGYIVRQRYRLDHPSGRRSLAPHGYAAAIPDTTTFTFKDTAKMLVHLGRLLRPLPKQR